MTEIEYYYQTIGRILVYLINRGLARVDLQAQDAMEIMTERRGDEEEVVKAFADCLRWMQDEGLIRVARSTDYVGGGYHFAGVQLTSKGIAVIKTDTKDDEIGGSIEKKVSDGANLDASTYTKIGEFVGSFLGSLTKSLAS